MHFPSIGLFMALAATSLVARAETNQLSETERGAGWQLLFDGHSFAGWRGYLNAPIAGWEVRDGTLRALAGTSGVALVTTETFRDFELAWEWRLPPKGNNGVKYLVTEARPTAPGHEYQMVDDESNPDVRANPLQHTAAFYDVLPPAEDKVMKPIGEWNTSKIVVHGTRVEHWLNGRSVLVYELGSPEVKAALAKSKFANERGFGDKIAGPIMLTYHSDDCWYRSIKVRVLN